MSTFGTKLGVGMLCCSKHQTSHSVILRDLHFCMCVRLICTGCIIRIMPSEMKNWWTMSLLLAVWCAFVPSVAESLKSD